VALVSKGLWQRLWGGTSNVLGQTLSLNSVPFTILGVLPAELGPLSRADVFIPLARDPNDGRGWYLGAVGRLKPGISMEAARQDLLRVHKAQIPDRSVNEITSPRLTPLRERLLGDYRPVVYILLAAVGVVWLIACGNVAGLMLARGLARSKEISIRMALGATRSAVVRQVLVESLILSALGGALGICLGQVSLSALIGSLGDQLPQWLHFNIDHRFFLFCLATTTFTALLFGFIPALQMVSKIDLQGALQATTSKTTGSSRQRRSLNVLTVAEIALALVLLVNAGLLLKAFRAVQRIDPGFRADHVLTYNLSLPGARYTNRQETPFFEAHLADLRGLPGVKFASATSIVPLAGHAGTFFQIENAPPKGKDEADPVVLVRSVFPDYAEAMGLTVLAGRFISDQETRGEGVRAVVVNESFAKKNWPNESPIGKRIKYPGTNSPWMNVVGLIKDEKHYGFDQPMRPGVFLPFHFNSSRQMTMVVRTANDPLALLPAVRAILKKADPELPVYGVRTMADREHRSMGLRRTYSWLFGFFATVALVMALAGVYGVISYAVSQRTNEIGIRMALGAQRADVLRLVLRHGLWLAAIGMAVGIMGALVLARLMRTLLFNVDATDPITLAMVPLLLGGVTLLACLLPARRATRVDPMEALREF
jgi:putative ABC transport system permease protein